VREELGAAELFEFVVVTLLLLFDELCVVVLFVRGVL